MAELNSMFDIRSLSFDLRNPNLKSLSLSFAMQNLALKLCMRHCEFVCFGPPPPPRRGREGGLWVRGGGGAKTYKLTMLHAEF